MSKESDFNADNKTGIYDRISKRDGRQAKTSQKNYAYLKLAFLFDSFCQTC
jgi:hypothetical protein